MQELKKEFILNFIEDNRWKYIVDGLKITLIVTIFAVLIGVLLGFLIAIVRTTHDKTGKLKILNAICKVYLTVIRGTPVVVQLMIIYFIIFGSVDISKVLVAIIAGVAVFSFKRLCAEARGASDYLAIARQFHAVIIVGIPKMGPDNRNEAARFVTLIDALYEYRVKLLASAAAMPDALYVAGDGAFEFERTASRLSEMQSDDYLALGHGPADGMPAT